MTASACPFRATSGLMLNKCALEAREAEQWSGFIRRKPRRHLLLVDYVTAPTGPALWRGF